MKGHKGLSQNIMCIGFSIKYILSFVHKGSGAYCSRFGSASNIGATSSASRPENIKRNIHVEAK